MPALRNPKHEKVALALFAGQENDAASAAAGYDTKASSFVANANKRAQRHGIPERVAELKADANAKDIELAEIKREWLLAHGYEHLQFNVDDYLSAPAENGNRQFDLGRASRRELSRLDELSVVPGRYGPSVKVKGDKLGWARFVADLQGFIKGKVEMTGKDGGPLDIITTVEQVIVDPKN